MYNIQNRRYIGNKFKLMEWISELIEENCKNCKSFFDVFAGTGTVTSNFFEKYDRFIINDFLYSNNAIYNGFFLNEEFDVEKLIEIKKSYESINPMEIERNYVSENYGDKFFNELDAKKIGYIREDIQIKYENKEINFKEYNVLISSLLYSFDRIANTLGHYDAYRKNKEIREGFKFELINLGQIDREKIVEIYRKDANQIAKEVKCDIAYIDPPYNSRQYSRFYHVLENITQWKKPELFGTALKPKEQNMSEYCKVSAPVVFEDLVKNIDAKYIVVSYNNTYNSKSNSSKNKIELEEIKDTLSKKGETKIFERDYKAFDAGKTKFDNHKEYIFITKVNKKVKKCKSNRSPLFYVGDKYKLMPEINKYIPENIKNYIEPFVGGGSCFLNVKAEKYHVNDINTNIFNIHKMLNKYSTNREEFFSTLLNSIDKYKLSCSYKGKVVPEELKKTFKKTYYAQYNKEKYSKLRADFNNDKEDTIKLYLLLIYGFNHMIRFNAKGDFNLPVGNVDFNANTYKALNCYFDYVTNICIEYHNKDYKTFLDIFDYGENDYVLLDPPYLISESEYNKIWSEQDEQELYDVLDKLDSRGVKFGITNLIYHKGKRNEFLEKWSKKYFVKEISSNYISFNDNTIKSKSKEVFVTNYEKKS